LDEAWTGASFWIKSAGRLPVVRMAIDF